LMTYTRIFHCAHVCVCVCVCVCVWAQTCMPAQVTPDIYYSMVTGTAKSHKLRS